MRDARTLTQLLNLGAVGVDIEPTLKATLVREAEDILKAKHDGRKDVETGRFQEMSRPVQTKVDGIVWTHNDTREHLAHALADTLTRAKE